MMCLFLPIGLPDQWAWMKERAHVIACEDSTGIVAYDDDGMIVAGVVADQWTTDSCQVHIAIEDPMVLRHGFLEEVANYLFNVCGRKRIFGLVPANNEKALKLDLHMGFEEVVTIPDGFSDGIDYKILRMTRDNRWLKKYEESL